MNDAPMIRITLIFSCILVSSFFGCAKPSLSTQEGPAYSVSEIAPGPHGQPVIALEQKGDERSARITRVEILPTRGMNVFRMRGWIPGKGEVELLAGPPPEESFAQMTGSGADQFGNASFFSGGPILIPY